MGLALLFGLTGAIRLDEIGASTAGLAASQAVRPALLALVLIVAALSFKITAVPFHYYAPDVYLATSNLNAGLLSVIPKVAGLVALVRLTALLAPVFPDFGWQLIVIISILTMTIGNLGALLQKNMRRLMAYSSIAHAGYMLIGVAVGLYGADQTLAYGGFSAAFLYLFVYAVASIGAFAALTEVETGEGTSADQVGKAETGAVTELAGLSRQRPWMAAAIGICMFSLAGLPPLAGFWGKLALFSSALTAYRSGAGNNWFLILAVVGVLNAAVAAAYYLRVISVIYFEEGIVPSRRQVSIPSVAAVIGGLAVVVIGLFPGNLVESFRRVGPSPIIASQDMLDDSMLDDAQRSARTSAHLTAKP
jgi:NADH-quinone oxidoreductase subunit N